MGSGAQIVVENLDFLGTISRNFSRLTESEGRSALLTKLAIGSIGGGVANTMMGGDFKTGAIAGAGLYGVGSYALGGLEGVGGLFARAGKREEQLAGKAAEDAVKIEVKNASGAEATKAQRAASEVIVTPPSTSTPSSKNVPRYEQGSLFSESELPKREYVQGNLFEYDPRFPSSPFSIGTIPISPKDVDRNVEQLSLFDTPGQQSLFDIKNDGQIVYKPNGTKAVPTTKPLDRDTHGTTSNTQPTIDATPAKNVTRRRRTTSNTQPSVAATSTTKAPRKRRTTSNTKPIENTVADRSIPL